MSSVSSIGITGPPIASIRNNDDMELSQDLPINKDVGDVVVVNPHDTPEPSLDDTKLSPRTRKRQKVDVPSIDEQIPSLSVHIAAGEVSESVSACLSKQSDIDGAVVTKKSTTSVITDVDVHHPLIPQHDGSVCNATTTFTTIANTNGDHHPPLRDTNDGSPPVLPDPSIDKDTTTIVISMSVKINGDAHPPLAADTPAQPIVLPDLPIDNETTKLSSQHSSLVNRGTKTTPPVLSHTTAAATGKGSTTKNTIIPPSRPTRSNSIPQQQQKQQQQKLEQDDANQVAMAEVITKYKQIDDLPRRVPALPPLTAEEKAELEVALQLDPNDPDEWWREDWSGNLALMQKEISNPVTKRRKVHKTEVTQTLWEWAQQSHQQHHSKHALRLGRNLLALVYRMAPPTAQRILGHASTSWEQDPVTFDIFAAIKRCSYDPNVLREDGWTTSPNAVFEGSASGGPKHIGKEIFWEGFEAVVIAYVLDSEIGDLWKAMWLDAHETFDLEPEELQKAIKKWERKYKKSSDKGPLNNNDATASARFAVAKDFSVEGIDHGIILATTYNPSARQGVFWPARVMHVSELDKSQTQAKRNSAKQKVNVVFLAPYWNTGGVPSVRGAEPFAGYPLYEMECIDVSEETIQPYPHDGRRGLNVHQLRVGFRFTGLPKHTFGRFLDSHRLAMALKLYAQDELMASTSSKSHATAALFDTHALAINTARFPTALLNLPFHYVLSKLKSPGKENAADAEEDVVEPTLQLAYMMKAMEPPRCFGKDDTIAASPDASKGFHDNDRKSRASSIASPVARQLLTRVDSTTLSPNDLDDIVVGSILSKYIEDELTMLAATDLPSATLFQDLQRLVIRANRIVRVITHRQSNDEVNTNITLKSLLQECLRMKSYGEDILAADCSLLDKNSKLILVEWRKTCERLFKSVTLRCSREGFGNGVTIVLSDSRCNQHITKEGCVERPVRLPAALKGARLAGAGASPSLSMKVGVEEPYIKLATDKFLEKTHTVSYLKKMKARCSAISPDVDGAHLTEGSDGEGGCDTTGSRGTFDAAVAGVAVAMKAVDLIVGGQCVNVFCATRPPGHHAGRDLHPMGAVSNGFCVLNPVACAAIYATTPPSEGGLGLKRAVVIDFDVHHGNGTQDILCSTYDPRFLYISMHAGGAQINGYETEDSDMDFPTGRSKKQEGIFPGRCGDTSPHKGVLNLPLGARVTPHDVGNALVTLIEPAVEVFSPDIIILSAGFDGHKNDPLGMGGLSANDFGHITEVACAMAFRFCSGRIMSVLEGGYGVPCCRPQKDLFLHPGKASDQQHDPIGSQQNQTSEALVISDSSEPALVKRHQPSKLMDLGEVLPHEMDDQVTPGLQRKLEKCHAEGFIECVREHVISLKNNNSRA